MIRERSALALLVLSAIVSCVLAPVLVWAKVQVLLDAKSESTNQYVLALFKEQGVTVRHDGAHAIAHNKVIVIDSQVVVTGSFNFTNSAETRNAENLLILSGASLAQAYRENWLSHWAHARP